MDREQSSGVSSAKSSRNGPGSASMGEKLVERELFELRQKLSSLESKLLNGDKSSSSIIGQAEAATATAKAAARRADSLLDANILKGFTQEQELELLRHQDELANQVGRERAIRDELERREEVEMLAKQSFSSIQQEVDSKRRLIRQVLMKVKSLRDEIDTSQASYRIELDELDQLQCVLQKELKLKCLIMDNFVPNCHVDQLLSWIVFDDKKNLCLIEPLQLATSEFCQITTSEQGERSAINFEDFWRPTYDSIRPQSEFERISEAIYPSNIRYKYEELIEPKLETNRRPQGVRKLTDKLRASGRDGSGSLSKLPDSKSSGLQEILNATLNQREADIVI